jgi:DNA-binding transcriptional MerR regulator
VTGEIEKAASAFRTISEVAEELQVPQHVLRFWETRFSAVRPIKRGGNRRYYRPEDMHLLKVINHLLYTDGYTIRGVQKLLREQGPRQLIAQMDGGGASAASATMMERAAPEPSGAADSKPDAAPFAPMIATPAEGVRVDFDPGPVSILVDKSSLLASLKQMRVEVAGALER